MSLQLLSYLASLGFRADLDTENARMVEREAARTFAAAEQDCDDASNLNFVLAL